jgi:hypothetical protein
MRIKSKLNQKRVKARITFFGLYGEGQKVISGFTRIIRNAKIITPAATNPRSKIKCFSEQIMVEFLKQINV